MSRVPVLRAARRDKARRAFNASGGPGGGWRRGRYVEDAVCVCVYPSGVEVEDWGYVEGAAFIYIYIYIYIYLVLRGGGGG